MHRDCRIRCAGTVAAAVASEIVPRCVCPLTIEWILRAVVVAVAVAVAVGAAVATKIDSLGARTVTVTVARDGDDDDVGDIRTLL